jgi:hypothetical protein
VRIQIDPHALSRLEVRGVMVEEVTRVVRYGVPTPADLGRKAKEMVFLFDGLRGEGWYPHKKVRVIYVEEGDVVVVVTVLSYFGRWPEVHG